MTAAHTPGPWHVRQVPKSPTKSFSECIVTDGEGRICSTGNEANARLIAAAPDHALVGWAMCVQDATWEEWGEGKGEFCFAGLRHATTLDEFGCPVLTPALRETITKARGQ